MEGKPELHGRDHRPGGTDPFTSGTAIASSPLEADGDGGIRWGTSSGSGIQFDTDNEGNWLYIRTNDETALGGFNGYGFEVFDHSSGGIKMKTFAALLLETALGLELQSHTGLINIHTDKTTSGATAAIEIQAPTGTIRIDAGADLYLQSAGAAAYLTLTAAGGAGLSGNAGVSIVSAASVEFNVGGVQTFRLDADGSVHGLASVGAITWDIV